jgi:nucleoside-diphosphate-sugar epimerase
VKVLVTGANGFIGSALCTHLFDLGHEVVPIVRGGYEFPLGQIVLPNDEQMWKFVLNRCDVVIHLAGRAHVMRESEPEPLRAFRAANLEPTMQLALRAVEAGVKRFIFISSIKVNGEETMLGEVFKPDDSPRPIEPYSVSKHETEKALLSFALKTQLEVIIIRPPLVYGPSAKGNFATLLKCITQGIPLPLSAITNNRRSLVSLYNLIDLIVCCMVHPNASNQIFLASDGEDLSTHDLILRVSKALGVVPRLFYVPPLALRASAMIFNKLDLYRRLCGSLQVDISKNQMLLDWNPPIPLDDGIRRAIQKL